jgi:3D (Asp-Asp-Asp) domain-containing protein
MLVTNLICCAYCACTICCGPKATGLTASGVKPHQGITVASSRSIPFGTKILINGHTYIVQDRLAKRYDSRVDIYFTKHTDALKFGKQKLTVTILP